MKVLQDHQDQVLVPMTFAGKFLFTNSKIASEASYDFNRHKSAPSRLTSFMDETIQNYVQIHERPFATN